MRWQSPLTGCVITLLMVLFAYPSIGQGYYGLQYTENKGQWEGDFYFRSDVGDASFFINKDGYTVLKMDPDAFIKALSTYHPGIEKERVKDRSTGDTYFVPKRSTSSSAVELRSHVYKVRFLGGNPNVRFEGDRSPLSFANYYLGNDASKWQSNIASYAGVVGRSLYPGVDIRYYSNGDNIKYDLILQPGSDPGRIQLQYDGVSKISVKDKQLLVVTSVGESKELEPIAYQIINGQKKLVDCAYEIMGTKVRYKLGQYNKNIALTIDPAVIIFSTYSGSRSGNWGSTAAPGPDGSLYGGGIVFGSDYPRTIGTGFSGGKIDMVISRFSSAGDRFVFSTYVGGFGDEVPHSIYVDGSGNAVVLGRTSSGNFPVKGPLGYLGGGGGPGTDIAVFRLSPTGELVSSAVIGGTGNDGVNLDTKYAAERPLSLLYNYGDNSRSEVILDAAGNIYIAASTSSNDFPLINATNSFQGAQDGVVIKFTPDLGSILYTTFIGGSRDDAAFVLAKHPTLNQVYVAGATLSGDLLNAVPASSSYASSAQGGVDGYIVVLDAFGSIINGSYFGTGRDDFIYGIQFDKPEPGKTIFHPFIMGISLGDWPRVGNPQYDVPGAHQFVSKLNPDLSGYVFSSRFGAAGNVPNISPIAFLVDNCENLYISGWGGKVVPCSQSFFDAQVSGTYGLPTNGFYSPFQVDTDNRDFYFTVLGKNSERLLFGSFFGQSGGFGDHVDGGTSRFDETGTIYQAICAGCYSLRDPCATRGRTNNFRVTRRMLTTPGSVAPVIGSNECNLGVVKINFGISLKARVQSFVQGRVFRKGCAPIEVEFRDSLEQGQVYIWDFGDGTSPDTTTSPVIKHLYTTIVDQTYTVKLVVIDNTTCNVKDSSYTDITLGINAVDLKIDAKRELPCTGNVFTLTNSSIPKLGGTYPTSRFIFRFSDGTTQDIGFGQSITKSFTSSNNVVWLKLLDPSFCNVDDSIKLIIPLDPGINARFAAVDDTVCLGEKIVLNDFSTGGINYVWDFGEPGAQFTGPNPPPYEYTTIGRKPIKLTYSEGAPCPKQDDTTIYVEIVPNPVARFEYTPQGSVVNALYKFKNTSVGGDSYFWTLGDGYTSTAKDSLSHMYNRSGNYVATLFVESKYGCKDKYSEPVQVLVDPLVNAPNAFTPNGDGVNDVFRITAFGVDNMDLRIYNRYGQLVFQTSDPMEGWDGTLKGVPQPMDVYTYTLVIQLSNALTPEPPRSGKITLIR
ncbi:MAG: T9SS type B sorting domain-containing protein [Bacteroidetes bacterium]|nr:T9SS type B sorting domain-containing protein [Bacteroidota bacterium]